MEFERQWSMPDSDTFDIEPIRELVTSEVNSSHGLWVDPFSGGCGYADVTNDLNPELDSDHTMKATDFLETFDRAEVDGGVLFDPPYSPHQVKEVYDSIGLEVMSKDTSSTFWSDVKSEIARVCAPGSTVVSCGWNSGGVGKTRGFETRRILLVPHGGWHNDTIVTVQDKVTTEIGDWNDR